MKYLLSTIFVFLGTLARAADPAYPLVPIDYPEKPEVDVSVISSEKANDLFRAFKADSSIPFNYALDGCYARATQMARIAEKSGVVMGKVFAEGNLRAQPDVPAAQWQAFWGWHVAPVAYVENPDGTRELKVFDPSLFNGPISLMGWESAMYHYGNPEAEIKHLYFRSRYEQWPKSYTQDHVTKTETRWKAGAGTMKNPFPALKDLYLPDQENKPGQPAMPKEHTDWSPEVLSNTESAMKSYKAYTDYAPLVERALKAPVEYPATAAPTGTTK